MCRLRISFARDSSSSRTRVAQRAVRVRSLDGEPLSQSTTYVPERIGRAYGAKDLASTPIIDLIERAGVVVGAAEQSISATLADSLIASRLKVGVGAPLLLMKRCVKDTSRQARPVHRNSLSAGSVRIPDVADPRAGRRTRPLSGTQDRQARAAKTKSPRKRR